jgi:regulator of replication initiation timing
MDNKKLLEEFEELKKENEQLRQILSDLERGATQEATKKIPPVPAPKGEAETNDADEWGDIKMTDSDFYNDIKLSDDYGVFVCSMLDHVLVLREQQHGGAEYIFRRSGEKRHIEYSSMVKVLNYNRKFLEKGFFAILDSQFCKKFGIKNAALPLGTATRLVEGQIPTDEAIDLLRAMPEGQREETLRQMVLKLMDNPNFYKASFLTHLEVDLGLRLAERAQDSLNVQKIYREAANRG